jgi:hypothetical protein
MICPCCGGSGVLPLTPLEFKVWDTLRRAPDGLACVDLTARIYADRADGGPISGTHCVWSHAFRANKKLAAIGQRIVASGGPGSIYRLQRVRADDDGGERSNHSVRSAYPDQPIGKL